MASKARTEAAAKGASYVQRVRWAGIGSVRYLHRAMLAEGGGYREGAVYEHRRDALRQAREWDERRATA